MQLYKIVGALQTLREQIMDGEEVDLEYLEDLEIAAKDKIEGCIIFIKELKAKRKALKEAQTEFRNREKSLERNQTQIQNYLIDMMKILNMNRFDSDLHSVRIAKSPLSVEILDEDLIPEDFIIEEIVRKPSKADLIQHYKDTGEEIEGVKISQKEHLR